MSTAAAPTATPPLSRSVGSDAIDAEVAQIIRDLDGDPPAISPKYFYDERGSRLFDDICRTPEYYPTRTEDSIMRRDAGAMASMLPRDVVLIELGSGSSQKTRHLLRRLPVGATYVPFDISGPHLLRSAQSLRGEFPRLDVRPLVGDFTLSIDVGSLGDDVDGRPVAFYFPGSTIGNFEPAAARTLLTNLAGTPAVAGLLIGYDRVKSESRLVAAYDDVGGVTAAFNRNVLTHLNRRFGFDFDVSAFEHEAVYDPLHRRIEMRLVAGRATTLGHPMLPPIERGEHIRTEFSHKYTPTSMGELLRRGGWRSTRRWTAGDDFDVAWCVPE